MEAKNGDEIEVGILRHILCWLVAIVTGGHMVASKHLPDGNIPRLNMV